MSYHSLACLFRPGCSSHDCYRLSSFMQHVLSERFVHHVSLNRAPQKAVIVNRPTLSPQWCPQHQPVHHYGSNCWAKWMLQAYTLQYVRDHMQPWHHHIDGRCFIGQASHVNTVGNNLPHTVCNLRWHLPHGQVCSHCSTQPSCLAINASPRASTPILHIPSTPVTASSTVQTLE
jgi:hypothetical protein